MNFKTTLVLFIAVVVLGVVIFFLKEKAPPPRPTIETTPDRPAETVEHDLIESDFGEATEIFVQAPDQPEWHFVKENAEKPGEEVWRITAPFEAKAQRWQVDQIARRLTSAKYVVKYAPDEAGAISADDAGLNPPRDTVRIVNADGKAIEVQIGRNEGDRETYVRLGDSGAIYRVKPSFKNLLKETALEYCDQQLFDVKANDIVRLSITERPERGEPTTYELVQTGADWMFEKPSRAKAVNDKIRELTSTFSTLRVVKWTQADVDDLMVYGLAPAAITVTATAEETPPAEETGDASTNGEETPATQPAPVTHKYTVQLADIGPLGDKTKVFLRRDDEHTVGTVMKTLADKFKPDMQAWRESAILEQNAQTARRVAITKDGKSTILTRAGTTWSYEETGAPADQVEVDRFLKNINGVKAVNFEEGAAENPARFGLDHPQGTVVLTFDNQESVTITVGGYADPDTRRLVYVRTGLADSVAKVRVEEADKLLPDAADFRDRQVVTVDPARFEGITIERPAGKTPEAGREKFSLAKDDKTWRMTEPVHAKADTGKVNKLIKTLSGLRGQKVIDADGNLADYGLDQPAIKVDYTYLPPQIFQMVPEEPAEGEASTQPTTKPAKMVAKPYQPPAETYTLLISQRDGKAYVARAERPEVVYMVGKGVYEQLTGEYHATGLFEFEPSQVSTVTLTAGDESLGFSKTDKGWQFIPEPDIPIDPKKVTNYLLQVKNLKADHFVDYNAADLEKYGLDEPAYRLAVEVEGSPLPELLVSSMSAESGGPYARLSDSNAVFVLPGDAVNRIRIDVAEFETPP